MKTYKSQLLKNKSPKITFERFSALAFPSHRSFIMPHNTIQPNSTPIPHTQHPSILAPLERTLYLLPVQCPHRVLFPGSKESGSIEACFVCHLSCSFVRFPGSKESGSIEAIKSKKQILANRKFPGSKESGSIEACCLVLVEVERVASFRARKSPALLKLYKIVLILCMLLCFRARKSPALLKHLRITQKAHH